MNALREAMVDQLWQLRAIRTDAVADAVRAVPRHLFVPEAPLEEAYQPEKAVVTKRDEHGAALSSVSAARVQAMMLEQAGLEPGHRVLEIGSGGYNAALIAELVGESGEVTTVDIDPDVVERARRCLASAGCSRVRVAQADGEEGEAQHAPYDRIIVTAGAWDIPPAWTDQLADGGRIVVPLRIRGLTRSIVFEREGGHLVSRDYQLCGFVPMQGAGENRERLVLLHEEEVGLRLDDGQRVDAERLREALSQPRAEAWSGVTVGGMEPFDDLDLWLATVLPGFALFTATPAARDIGITASAAPLGVSALVEEAGFAYRGVRPTSPERITFEFGAYGHGPEAQKTAERMVEQIQLWDRDHRSGPGARFEAYPADTPEDRLPSGLVVDKAHTRIAVTWPTRH